MRHDMTRHEMIFETSKRVLTIETKLYFEKMQYITIAKIYATERTMHIVTKVFCYAITNYIESKKLSNDQELIQSDPKHPALKTKRKITKYIN